MQNNGEIKIFLLMVVFTVLLSCSSSHPMPEIIGNWRMVDNWSLVEGDYVPRKEDSNYQAFHEMQEEQLKDFTFFYGKEYFGTVDKNGDTANFYPYVIQEDSLLFWSDQREIIRLTSEDTLLRKRGLEYQLFVRKSS